MGLTITAYSNLKSVGKHIDGSRCPVDGHVVAFCYDLFAQSFRGLPILAHDVDHGLRFLNGGCYEPTEQTDSYEFDAGTHGLTGSGGGGYNRWRIHLAGQFNPMEWAVDPDSGMDYLTEPDPGKPFYELLWFADNEGTIGPEAAADLLADFRQAGGYVSWDPRWDPFWDWGRAFELAADNGLIHFH